MVSNCPFRWRKISYHHYWATVGWYHSPSATLGVVHFAWKWLIVSGNRLCLGLLMPTIDKRTDLKSCHVGHLWEMEVHVSSILVLPPNWTLVEALRPALWDPGPALLLQRKLWLLAKQFLDFFSFWNLGPGTRGVFLPKMCLKKRERYFLWFSFLKSFLSLHLSPSGHMREGRSSIKEVEHDDRHDDRYARDCHHSR